MHLIDMEDRLTIPLALAATSADLSITASILSCTAQPNGSADMEPP